MTDSSNLILSSKSTIAFTEQERFDHIVNAIWFAAHSYAPPEDGKPLMVVVDAQQAARNIISILNDLELISRLPDTGNLDD